ncbi:MAG: hypothetical protein GX418_09360 [Clostridiales bacterium]|nr:hypothetical protein [Clostridiales bacterium]
MTKKQYRATLLATILLASFVAFACTGANAETTAQSRYVPAAIQALEEEWDTRYNITNSSYAMRSDHPGILKVLNTTEYVVTGSPDVNGYENLKAFVVFSTKGEIYIGGLFSYMTVTCLFKDDGSAKVLLGDISERVFMLRDSAFLNNFTITDWEDAFNYTHQAP